MNAALIRAHHVAQEIELIIARTRAAECKRTRDYTPREHEFYDPHAAHEMGELIYKRMHLKK